MVQVVDNCTNLTEKELGTLKIVRGSTAMFCATVIISMLMVLCITKAYSSFIQRLFFYLLMTTALLVCHIAIFEFLLHYYPRLERICPTVGFITDLIDNIVNLIHFSIIISTSTLAFLSFKSVNVTLAIRWKVFLEGIYLVLMAFLPLAFMWVPLMKGSYGKTVAWCWIKTYDANCTTSNDVSQMIFSYGIYEVTGIVGICVMVVVTIAYCKVSASFVHVKMLLFQSLTLTLFVLLFVLVINLGMAIRMFSVVNNIWTHPYPMWLFYGAMIPLWHLIIPCGFMGSFYFRHFRNICCNKRYRQYEIIQDSKNTHIPVSERVTAPSNTFFNVPYTNGFTNVEYSHC